MPTWLSASKRYDPPPDRDRFLGRNVLTLVAVLSSLRTDPSQVAPPSPLDRALLGVRPALRLTGAVTLIACIGLARNLAFVWMMLAGLLVALALRPARSIRPVLASAIVTSGAALAINLPSILLGQPGTPVRVTTKSLVTVGIMGSVTQALGAEGLVAALRGLGLPMRTTLVVDLALRNVVLLGETATSLSESLALRCVGRDTDKTSSVAGVLGVTFLHAQRLAMARAEAMELRGFGEEMPPATYDSHLVAGNVEAVAHGNRHGYDGARPTMRRGCRRGWASIPSAVPVTPQHEDQRRGLKVCEAGYLIFMAVIVGLLVYFEAAMP